jgi:non-ribosomal peptide synthetase component F
MHEHQSYTYDDLVGDLSLEKNTSRNPLFDVMIILQNQWEGGIERSMGNLTLKVKETVQPTAGFDLAFEFSEQSDGLHLAVNFNTDIYSTHQVNQLMGHLHAFLPHLVNHPNDSISSHNILTDDELSQLVRLSSLNQLKLDVPSLPELFRKTVLEFPDKTAIIHQDRKYTFNELDVLSDRLGRHIINTWHPKEEELIALLVPRSEWWVISILAVWKAGAAYLPLDLDFPEERVGFIGVNNLRPLRGPRR